MVLMLIVRGRVEAWHFGGGMGWRLRLDRGVNTSSMLRSRLLRAPGDSLEFMGSREQNSEVRRGMLCVISVLRTIYLGFAQGTLTRYFVKMSKLGVMKETRTRWLCSEII
jgi:hypothetical protein